LPPSTPYKTTAQSSLTLLLSIGFSFLLNVAPSSACEVPLEPGEVSQETNYDWVRLDQLDPQQHKSSSPSCRGAYVDPMSKKQVTKDFSDEEINVEAGSSVMESTHIILEDEVEISQGSRQLKADYMAYDKASDKAELKGNVVIRQPGILVTGDSAKVNMAGGEASFKGGEFVMHQTHLRGSAGSIEQDAEGKIKLEKGKITSCEPGSESWVIKGSKLTINPETQMGSGRNVSVEVAGIPVFYMPYFTFPMGGDRQSGLLIPAFGTSEGGLDITVPFYWNIAPNYDATIAPRFAQGHGSMFEGEFRFMNRFSFNSLNVALLENDQGGGDPDVDILIAQGEDERLLRPYKGDDRWLMDFQHQGGDKSRWYTNIDFVKASDLDYFRDLSARSFDTINSTHLNQSFTLGYRPPNWDVSLRVQEFQNLLVDVEDSYQQRPRLNFDGRYTWGHWSMDLNHELVDFDHKDTGFITGRRANLDYKLEHSQQWLWGFARQSLGVRSLAYDLDLETVSADYAYPALTAPYASFDTGLFFEREDGRQTFEPRLFYLYSAHKDHKDLFSIPVIGSDTPQDINFDSTLLTFSYDQLFRDRRFAGGDRIEDANQLSIGATTRLYGSKRNKPFASFSFGKVIYFSHREVSLTSSDTAQTLEESDLAAQMMARINSNIQLKSDLLYNPKSDRIMRARTGVEYQDTKDRKLKLNYRYVREDSLAQATLPVNQMDTAMIWPTGAQWQMVGRVFYDLDRNKELDAFIGFEYDECCYRVRLLARRWLDSKLADLVNDTSRHYDEGLFIEFDLKGLASSSQKIQKLLKETLPDF